MKLFPSILAMLLAGAVPAGEAVAAQGKKAGHEPATPYRVLQKIPIPGDGGYDYLYLDEPAQRLYVSHGAEVAVLDATSGAIVGVIAGLAGVHGISVDQEGNFYVAEVDSGRVQKFTPRKGVNQAFLVSKPIYGAWK